jgi:hypothetical protein
LQGKKVPRRLLRIIKELEENGVTIPYYKTPCHSTEFAEEIEPDKSY